MKTDKKQLLESVLKTIGAGTCRLRHIAEKVKAPVKDVELAMTALEKEKLIRYTSKDGWRIAPFDPPEARGRRAYGVGLGENLKIRMSESDLSTLDDLAKTEGVDRSQAAREAFRWFSLHQKTLRKEIAEAEERTLRSLAEQMSDPRAKAHLENLKLLHQIVLPDETMGQFLIRAVVYFAGACHRREHRVLSDSGRAVPFRSIGDVSDVKDWIENRKTLGFLSSPVAPEGSHQQLSSQERKGERTR